MSICLEIHIFFFWWLALCPCLTISICERAGRALVSKLDLIYFAGLYSFRCLIGKIKRNICMTGSLSQCIFKIWYLRYFQLNFILSSCDISWICEVFFCQQNKGIFHFPILGSHVFWRIAKAVINKGKSAFPPLFIFPELLSSVSDYCKRFLLKITNLDGLRSVLLTFPSRTN